MPIQRTPKHDIEYLLIRYDENGVELPENDAAKTMLSRVAIQRVADPNEAITDVFFTSHGWKGDIPEAIRAVRQLDRRHGGRRGRPRLRAQSGSRDSSRSSSGCIGQAFRSAMRTFPAENGRIRRSTMRSSRTRVGSRIRRPRAARSDRFSRLHTPRKMAGHCRRR